MCLLVFAWRSHPDYPLILVGNRDEFYTRRTRPAAWWGQAVSLLAGHDEEAGGTWLGITRRGRFAALTNVRAPTERNPHAPSRGALVLSALQAPQRGGEWLEAHAPKTVGLQRLQPAGRRRAAERRRRRRVRPALLQQPAGTAGAVARTGHLRPVERLPRHAVAQGHARRRRVRLRDRRRGRARPAGPADGAARRGARLRTPRDRRAARLGARAVGDPDPRQRLRHADDHAC